MVAPSTRPPERHLVALVLLEWTDDGPVLAQAATRDAAPDGAALEVEIGCFEGQGEEEKIGRKHVLGLWGCSCDDVLADFGEGFVWC